MVNKVGKCVFDKARHDGILAHDPIDKLSSSVFSTHAVQSWMMTVLFFFFFGID